MSDTTKAVMLEQVEPESVPIIRSMVGIVSPGIEKPPLFSPTIGLRSVKSWAYAALMLNANKVGSIPLRLYAKKRNGSKALTHTAPISKARREWLTGERSNKPSLSVMTKATMMSDDMVEVVGDHPITDLLRKVNPYSSGYDLLTMTAFNLDALGDAYWALALSGLDTVSQLWRLPPQYTRIIPGRDRLIDGYMFGQNKAQAIVLDPDEVIHFRGPQLNDIYYGAGKLEAMWNIVQQNAAMHEMDYSTFANQARPDFAVSVEGGASPEQIKAFSDELSAQLRGTKKAGNYVVTTGKVSFTPLNWIPKDVAGRDRIVEEIAAVAGCPVSKLMTNTPNLANAESGDYQWSKDTILPMTCRIEEVLNQRLVPYFDDTDSMVLAFDDPVPENRQYMLEEMRATVSIGIRSANEARRVYLGEQPVDEPTANMLLVNGQIPGQAAPAPFDLAAPNDPAPPTEQSQDDPQEADEPADDAEEAAINGEQLTSLIEVVRTATAGEIPVEAARIMARRAFSFIPEEEINALFDAIRPKAEEPSKAMLGIAALIDKYNAKHGDTVSLVDGVKAYAGAA